MKTKLCSCAVLILLIGLTSCVKHIDPEAEPYPDGVPVMQAGGQSNQSDPSYPGSGDDSTQSKGHPMDSTPPKP